MAKEVKKLSDVLPEKEEIFPNTERVKWNTLIGKEFVIKEVKEMTGETGNYHIALITIKGDLFSTSVGGKVPNEKIKIAIESLPVSVKLIEVKGKDSGRMYYDLE